MTRTGVLPYGVRTPSTDKGAHTVVQIPRTIVAGNASTTTGEPFRLTYSEANGAYLDQFKGVWSVDDALADSERDVHSSETVHVERAC